MSRIDNYHWITRVGLNTNPLHLLLEDIPSSSDGGPYYTRPVRFTRAALKGQYSLELGINSAPINTRDTFWLCDMAAWAAHYGLESPWGFLLTTTLAVMESSHGAIFKPDPVAMKKVLNPRGITTPWHEDGAHFAYEPIRKTLQTHYPLDRRNTAFAGLAQSRELLLSSFALYLATLDHQRGEHTWDF